jgi:hypothetical protein
MVSFTARPLYHREKRAQYPLDKRLGGPQSKSGQYREEKHLVPLLGIEPPFLSLPARDLVAIPTEPSLPVWRNIMVTKNFPLLLQTSNT